MNKFTISIQEVGVCLSLLKAKNQFKRWFANGFASTWRVYIVTWLLIARFYAWNGKTKLYLKRVEWIYHHSWNSNELNLTRSYSSAFIYESYAAQVHKHGNEISGFMSSNPIEWWRANIFVSLWSLNFLRMFPKSGF